MSNYVNLNESSDSEEEVRPRSTFCCIGDRHRDSTSSRPVSEATEDEELVVLQRGPSDGDGLGAMGAMVAATGSNLGSLPEVGPQGRSDLRAYLRVGDILNYLGGNIWGHVVLLLATPRGVEGPLLFDMQPLDPKGKPMMQVAPRMLARNPVIYLCKVLQSASNMPDINVTSCAMVVHPRTGQVCAVKSVPGGVQICGGREGPVVVECLMSPFSNRNMDFPNFFLAMEETHRVPVDTMWSFRTAVRSYLRGAGLWQSKYRSDTMKRWLARSMSKKWRRRPVCSTVPPRVWQKYLLKGAVQHCRSFPPSAGGAPANGEKDVEVIWVQAVLDYMPVKDDRVLPEELVRILLEQGRWERLDLASGPPPHRADDGMPEEATLFNQPRVNQYVRGNVSGFLNGEGNQVNLGANFFTVYCGRRFSKAKTMEGRVGHDVLPGPVPWDGCCGPVMGPQCPACRSLEDALPA